MKKVGIEKVCWIMTASKVVKATEGKWLSARSRVRKAEDNPLGSVSRSCERNGTVASVRERP